MKDGVYQLELICWIGTIFNPIGMMIRRCMVSGKSYKNLPAGEHSGRSFAEGISFESQMVL